MTETQPEMIPEQMAERLTQAALRLSELMENEVVMLEAMRSREIEAHLPDKRAAAKDYRELIARLADDPSLISDLDPRDKAVIKTAATRLALASEANARALRAGIEANTRLVKAIAQAVRESQALGDRYQANGSLSETGSSEAPLAVSVNQVL